MHTTTLLGVAKVLAKIQDDFSGYVKLFFQPAEETDGGAEPMIKEGHLENPHVDAMLGIHVTDSYNVGEVRFCYDTMQAYSDEITIVVNGYSAHAAHPENGVDGILIASQIINNIQSISSRNVSPTDSIALSFGKINGGTIANALAQKVVIDGTLRTLTKSTRDMAINNLKRLCQNIAEGYGGSAEVIITPCYPALINNKEMVDYVKEKAYQVFDSDKIFVNNVPSLGVEDFAYFAQAVPSCFYNLGIKNEQKGINAPLHNRKFDVDEEAMKDGVLIQVLSTITYLNK
jgi:amidohydrolase